MLSVACVCVQMSKSVTGAQELGALANSLTHSYSDLATESCRIAIACPAPQVIIYQASFSTSLFCTLRLFAEQHNCMCLEDH